jgi:hypothetical protein
MRTRPKRASTTNVRPSAHNALILLQSALLRAGGWSSTPRRQLQPVASQAEPARPYVRNARNYGFARAVAREYRLAAAHAVVCLVGEIPSSARQTSAGRCTLTDEQTDAQRQTRLDSSRRD